MWSLLVTNWGWISGPPTVLITSIFAYYWLSLSKPDSDDCRQLRNSVADHSGSEQLYLVGLSSLLHWADRFYHGQLTASDQPEPHPWSARAYDKSLLLAVIYLLHQPL